MKKSNLASCRKQPAKVGLAHAAQPAHASVTAWHITPLRRARTHKQGLRSMTQVITGHKSQSHLLTILVTRGCRAPLHLHSIIASSESDGHPDPPRRTQHHGTHYASLPEPVCTTRFI